MKILVVTLGSLGDLLPFLAVGEALRARGHRIVFASNAGYAAVMKMAGFEFSPVWDKTLSQQSLDDLLARDPAAAWRLVQQEMFVPATAPTCQFIAREAQAERCVVLASWSAFGARLAREKHNISLCSAYLSPHALQEDQDAACAGLPRADRSIGFFPQWFCAAPPDPAAGLEMTGFPLFDDALVPALPTDVTEFLQEGPPPILFTPGSFVRRADAFFRESLTACESLEARAIFLTPHRDQIPASLPRTVRHFKYVALQRLADKASALVHHGGIGTCAQAMRAGIAQLIVPVFFDQAENAACVESLGIGKSISPQRYDGRAAAQELDRLLHSAAVKRGGAKVKDKFAARDPVRRICEIIEAMA